MATSFVLSDIYALVGWVLIAYLLKYVYNATYRAFWSPLSKVPGPKLAAFSYLPNEARQAWGIRWKWIQLELFPKYGKVVRTSPSAVMFSDRDVCKKIAQEEDLPKDLSYSLLRSEPANETLFSATSREFHKQRRRILSPAFSISYLAMLEPLMSACVQDLVDKLDKKTAVSQKAMINVCDLMNKLTLDVIGTTAFGGSFDLVKTGDHPLPQKVTHELRYRIVSGLFPFLSPLVGHDDYLDTFTTNIIKQRRQQEGSPRRDILQIMLDAKDEDMKLTDKAILDQLIEFIIAGNDTTAFSVTMCIIQLLKHPSKMQTLIKELDEAFPDISKGELPSESILKKLPWLNACIKESLRLWPITLESGTGRVADRDIFLGGYLIPKGTEAIPNYYALHHSAEYWGDDVEEYKPERFLNQDEIPRDCYFPFSAGSRSCIGNNFAMLEMRLIIASLVLQYDLEDIPGQNHTDVVSFATPRLRSKQYMIRVSSRR